MSRLGAIFVVGLLALGCASENEPEITVGIDGCSSCGMVIDRASEGAVYFVAGEQRTFCSPGCLLESFESRRHRGEPPPERVYFGAAEGGGFVGAESAVFLISSHVPSVMNWGYRAYANHQAAAAAMAFEDEETVDWPQLRTRYGRPDVTLELTFGPGGLEPEITTLAKGQLVEWRIVGHGLAGPATLELKGYPELTPVEVPPDGEAVVARLLATRPGAGFPFVRVETGDVVGQLRVEGAHTADEEAR